MLSFLRSPPPFEPPHPVHAFLSCPLRFILSYVNAFLLFLRGSPYRLPKPSARIRLVCVSDTHNLKPAFLPPGDIIIHAGDLTNNGSVTEIQAQIDWLDSLPFQHKILIAGNHDSFFDPRSRRPEDEAKHIHWGSVNYLQHSSLTLRFPKRGNRELKFYGAPQIPECGGDGFAFQYNRHEDAWSGTIPNDTDVLITHTPPRYHLDLPQGQGCEFLLKEVWRAKPRVHVFGHVHAARGREIIWWDKGQAAWERVNRRKGWDIVDVLVWAEGFRVLWYGVKGALRICGWGGEANGSVMINAALMYRNTGYLGNQAEVIDL